MTIFLPGYAASSLVVESQGPLDREFLWHAFPIGNDMGEDLVHGVDEFRMVDEGLPVIRGRHRNRTVSLHTPNNLDQLGCGVFVPEHGLIAHDQTSDIGIAPGELERGRDLTLVSGVVLIDPDAKRDVKPELSRNLGNAFQTLGRSICADRLCLAAIAVRSARICASGTVRPAEGEPSKRLYETLASLSSTELPSSPDFSAPRLQDGCCDQAEDKGQRAQRHRTASAGLVPTNSPPRSISSAVFMSAPCGAHNV